MPKPRRQFLSDRLKGFGYAIKGLLLLIKTEHNFQIQLFCAIAVTALGLLVGLSTTEWILQFLAIGFVLAAEALNSAIERVADVITKEPHKEIGKLKDVAAAAPLIAALIAVIIAMLIYLPKIS